VAQVLSRFDKFDLAPHDSWSFRPAGFRGLHDSLRQLGYKVGRWTRSYGGLDATPEGVLLVLDPNEEVPLLSSENPHLAGMQGELLRDWVENGGRVVFTLPGRDVVEIYGIDFASTSDRAQSPSDSLNRWPSFRALLADLPATRSAPLPGRLQGSGPFAGFARTLSNLSGPRIQALAPYLTTPSVPEEETGEDLEPLAPPAMAVFPRSQPYDALLSLNNDPIAIENQLGAGRVVAFSSPLFFANAALERWPATEAVLRILDDVTDEGARTIYFDEYAHGEIQRGGVLQWVWETALFYPLATILLGIFLSAWRGSVRLGPPCHERVLPRRAKEEFVLSISDLYRRGEHCDHAVVEIAKGYNRQVSGLLGERSVVARRMFEHTQVPAPMSQESTVLESARRLHAVYLKELSAIGSQATDKVSGIAKHASKR